jgi:hypothetical protein
MTMIHASLSGLLLTLVAMQAPPTAPSASESPRATYTAQQLRTGLLETADKIKSLHVVYRSDDYDPERYPKGTFLYREIIAKSPGSLHEVSAHGHAAMAWEDDPFQQSAYVTDDHAFNEHPVDRAYFEDHIDPKGVLPGTLPNEAFCLGTGIWPFDGRPAPRPLGRPYVLRDVARAEDFAVVRPRQERVDGRWCHVLEWPGKDRLWLDTERGFVLLAREMFLGKWGALGQRFELGGHREVAPGIWLPSWIHNLRLDCEAPTEEGRRRRLIDARLEILRADVGPVDDSAFVFRPRPGSLKMTGRDTIQTQPGGLDYLDDVAHWVEVHAPASRPPARPAIPISAVAFLPAILFIVACEVRRRRAARPPVAMEHPH